MKREPIDFFIIEPSQLDMHRRLENWSRYVSGGRGSWTQAPIWKLGKSNGRQWHQPEFRPSVDTLDGHKLEKAVAALPEPHRDAIRWAYVFTYINPGKMRRHLGVTDSGLAKLVKDARSMLVNRRV